MPVLSVVRAFWTWCRLDLPFRPSWHADLNGLSLEKHEMISSSFTQTGLGTSGRQAKVTSVHCWSRLHKILHWHKTCLAYVRPGSFFFELLSAWWAFCPEELLSVYPELQIPVMRTARSVPYQDQEDQVLRWRDIDDISHFIVYNNLSRNTNGLNSVCTGWPPKNATHKNANNFYIIMFSDLLGHPVPRPETRPAMPNDSRACIDWQDHDRVWHQATKNAKILCFNLYFEPKTKKKH